MLKVNELTPFYYRQILKRAKNWQAKHLFEIALKIKEEQAFEPIEPTGYLIFIPSDWSGANWLWFSKLRDPRW